MKKSKQPKGMPKTLTVNVKGHHITMEGEARQFKTKNWGYYMNARNVPIGKHIYNIITVITLKE